MSNDPANTAMDENNFDMNDFVNFDQEFVGSPTMGSIKLEPHHSADARSAMDPSPSQQRMYNGPSHDYGQFRQQTGLPMGAVSHVKAVNAYSNQMRPSNLSSSAFPGYNTGYDFDFDNGPSNDMTTYFYSTEGQSEDRAVDPSAIAPDSQSTSATRAWPGMHSQQAKAEAAAKEAEVAAQQQRQEQQIGMQQPLPTNFEQSIGRSSHSQPSSEPEVNDQITRLLNQMRHNSASTSNMDDDDDDIAGDGPNSARSKKDEEDLDEDERLLASEEGKKLTSKERRQLRNKVSARAFRSRRKEYITQLEGEVAVKVAENNEVKNVNRHLLEQNRQLTQLTRTMLAHPAFNTFMQDMSNDPSMLTGSSQSTSTRQQSEQTQQQQQERSQPPPRQHNRHQSESIHVGLSMIPENNLDLSLLNLGANHWAGGNFNQPRIYAVHDLPAGPSPEELSASRLSGKAAEHPMSLLPSLCELDMPNAAPAYGLSLLEVKRDCPAPRDCLYADSPIINPKFTSSHNNLLVNGETSSSAVAKPSVPESSTAFESEAVAVQSIDRSFAVLEFTVERIAAMTFSLPR